MGTSESMPQVTSGLCAVHEHKTAGTSIPSERSYKATVIPAHGKRKRCHGKPSKSQCHSNGSDYETSLEDQFPGICGHRLGKHQDSEQDKSETPTISSMPPLPTLLTSSSMMQRAGHKEDPEKPQSLKAKGDSDLDIVDCEPQRRVSVDSLTSRLSAEAPDTFRVLEEMWRAPLRRSTPYFCAADSFDSDTEVGEEAELPSMTWLQKQPSIAESAA